MTEANGDTTDLFGEERLEQLLREAPRRTSDEVCQSIVRAVDQYSRDDLKDDVTVLALCRRPRPLTRPVP